MIGYSSDLTGAFIDAQLTRKFITPLGGIAIKLVNETGSASVKGTLAEASESVNGGFQVLSDEFDCIGIVYEDGIDDGEECWIIVSGIAEVLIADGTASTVGYWASSSTTDGRADITVPLPSGGTIQELQNHFKEIGHCLESKSSGTNVLAKVMLHFN